jgi:3-oxosteroid 1-dehydrogenase
MAGECVNESFDVIVVGTGAAALTAAVVAANQGRSVLVLERASLLGGTSAFSGGMLWMPNSAHFAERGGQDSPEAAGEYIRGLTQGRQYDDHLIDVFVDQGPLAVDYLEKASPLRLTVSRYYSDYFADRPGGAKGGRSIIPVPFGARDALGPWFAKLRDSPHFPVALTLDEMAGASGADPRNIHSATMTSSDLPALVAQRASDGVVTNGRALVAALLAGALGHGAVVRTNARVVGLVMEGGRAAGAVADTGDGRATFRAASGVVLGSGGFEWNSELVLAFLGILDAVPLGPPGNEGDALVMGMKAGAALANMSCGWNYPISFDPAARFEGRPRGTFGSTRFEAGSIAVNQRGKRFVNEAAAYVDVPKAFWRYEEATQSFPNQPPTYLIFDQTVRDRAVVNDLRPGQPAPGWVTEARSLPELAASLGIDAEGLQSEVVRFNENARRGMDPDFKRGTVWFEGQTRGGPTPESTLAPIVTPPFYAMEFRHGLLGTAGGLRDHARTRSHVRVPGRPVGQRGWPLTSPRRSTSGRNSVKI